MKSSQVGKLGVRLTLVVLMVLVASAGIAQEPQAVGPSTIACGDSALCSSGGPAVQVVNSGTGPAILGQNTSGAYGAGIFGKSSQGAGLRGQSNSGYGVFGASYNLAGVRGKSTWGAGVKAESVNGVGLLAESTYDDGARVYAPIGNGIYVSSAGASGVYVSSAGTDGVAISSAAYDGLHVGNAGDRGVFVNHAESVGLAVSYAGNDGAHIWTAGEDGVHVGDAASHGIRVDAAGNDGAYVASAGGAGFHVGEAAASGLHVGLAQTDGVYVNAAVNHGVRVYASGLDGVHVDAAMDDGVHVESVTNRGFFVAYALQHGVDVYSAGADGVHVSYADGDGVYANTDAANQEWGLYTPDKLYVGAGLVTGGPLMLVAQNGDEGTLESGDVVVAAGLGQPFAGSPSAITLVRRASAANSQNVAGVVHRRFVAEEKVLVQELEGEVQSYTEVDTHTTDGAIAPGEYLLIVVAGTCQIKVDATAAPVHPGDALAISGTPGHAGLASLITVEGISFYPPGVTFGTALEPIEGGTGLVHVYIAPR
jgi:hypothetical protein